MRISTKRVLAVGVAFCFLVGALLVYLNLVRGQTDAIEQVRASLASKEALYESQRQIVQQVENLIQQFQNVAALRASVGLAMPNGQENIGALRQIEAISQVSNVLLSSVDFKASVPRPLGKAKESTVVSDLMRKLGVLTVTMTMSGSYADLKEFLSKLETTVRLANVKQVKFQPAGGPGAPDRVTITAEMYYQE